MRKKWIVLTAFIFILGITYYFFTPTASFANDSTDPYSSPNFFSSLSPTPIFKNPVVPNAPISGFFDHYKNGSEKKIVFYDGRQNNGPNYGFQFTCSNPVMNDYVGCEDDVSGEQSCALEKQLWYNDHEGIDYEYSNDWYTGATCNINQFSGITRSIYAPASGIVDHVGLNDQFNGNYIFLKHDLNNNGNYEDDNFRSAYLHFYDIAVAKGQIIKSGDYLGEGGSSGCSSTPHLHFHVQRSNDNFLTKWSVDPYGWQGTGSDPWLYPNYPLWKYERQLPLIKKDPTPTPVPCKSDFNMMTNGYFESGKTGWVEESIYGIISNSNPVMPYEGNYLAWFGGKNDQSDILSQYIQVPPGTIYGDFRYVVLIATEETQINDFDTLDINLYTSNGTYIDNIDSISNKYAIEFNNHWYIRHNPINLSAYQGQVLIVKIESSTDWTLPTSFFIDGIMFHTKCYTMASIAKGSSPDYSIPTLSPGPIPTKQAPQGNATAYP